jgi:hypothetical protein
MIGGQAGKCIETFAEIGGRCVEEHSDGMREADHLEPEQRRSMSKPRPRPLNSKRPRAAAWRVRERQPVWKSRCGCARLRTDVGWILPVKACWKDSRWEAISFWSMTRGGSFARERPRSRRSWLGSSIGWGVVPRVGGAGWRNFARVDCSVGDPAGQSNPGGVARPAAPRQDVHRPDQPGLRFPGLCVHAGGAGGVPAGGRTVRGTGVPA